MSLIGLLAILISFAGVPFAVVRSTPARILIALGIVVAHLITTMVYFSYVLTHIADTAFYYTPPPDFKNVGFGLGTVFVVDSTQFLKKSFNATYLDCFLAFQTMGVWGVMIMMRMFEEIHAKMRQPMGTLPCYLLFIPGIHFWTSAIGKDAPLFFAISLCTWSVLNFSSRIFPFVCGLAVMVMFRAHIALITVIAISIAALLHGRMTIGRKFLLLAVAVGATGVLINAVNNTLTVDVTSASSVSDFFQDRDAIASTDVGATSIGDAPFLIRLFSLLFRPLFIDARSLMGLVPSAENVGSIFLFGYLFANQRKIRDLAKRVYFIRYTIAVSVVLILLLSLINYNVGLGLRQRTMLIPPLLALFVSAWAYRVRPIAELARGQHGILSRQQLGDEPAANVLGARAP